MTNLFRLSLLLLCFVGVCTSCKKNASKTTSPASLSYTSSATGPVSTTSVEAHGGTGFKVAIIASLPAGRFEINIDPYTGTTGTFNMSVIGQANYMPNSGATSVLAASGSVTLTSVSPNMVGTYNYVATDGSSMAGSFTVPAP